MSGNASANATVVPLTPAKASELSRRSDSPSGTSTRAQSELAAQTDESDLDTGLPGAAETSESTGDSSNTQSGAASQTGASSSSRNYSFDLQFDTFQLPSCARNCESVHTVKCHQKELCKALYTLYKDGEYCDTTIRIGSRTIQCHKLVLVCVSGYFRSMFSSGMRESVENAVELRDLPDEAVASLIDFAYSGQIVLSTDNVQRLLFAASVLQVESVCVACDAFVRRHLTACNCVGVRTFAELHGRFELMRAVDAYIADHLPLVLSSAPDEFLAMSEASLGALLRQTNLNVPNEQAVYDALLRWARFDETHRAAFERLAALVRFGQLPTEFLIQTVCNEPLVQASADCLRYVDEAKTFKLAQSFLPTQPIVPPARPVSVAAGPSPPLVKTAGNGSGSASSAYSNAATADGVLPCPRWPYASAAVPTGSVRCTPRRSYAGVIFCVGGRGSTGEPYRSVECYNPVDNSWSFIAEMTSKRRHVGVISCGGRLYAIGGHDGVEHLNTGEVYEPRNNRWTRIANMMTKRRGLALASIGSAIYALGGLDDSTCMSAVERYNINTDQWATVASMNVPRGGVACVVFANHIYAAGGNDGTNSVDSCEVFDPVLDRWSIIASMHSKRAGAGIAALHDYVYVVGGFDNDLPLNTVEQYDFRTNTWSVITHMSVCRGGAGLAALANRLYTVGGHDGSDYLLSVECFDPLEKRWINDVANISISRAGAGVTSCDVPIRVILDALESSHSHAQSTGAGGTGNAASTNANTSVSQLAYGLQHASISSAAATNTSARGSTVQSSSRSASRSNNTVTSALASATPPPAAHATSHTSAATNAGGTLHSSAATSSVAAYSDDLAQSNAMPHQAPDWTAAQQCASALSSSCVYHHCNAYPQPAYQNVTELRHCSAGVHHAPGSGSTASGSGSANASASATHQRQHTHHCNAVQLQTGNLDSASPPPPPNVVYVCPYHQQLAKSSNSRQRPASTTASNSGGPSSSNQHSFDQD